MKKSLLIASLFCSFLYADMAVLFHLDTFNKSNPAVLISKSGDKELFLDGTYALYEKSIDGTTTKERTLSEAQGRGFFKLGDNVYSLSVKETLAGSQHDPRFVSTSTVDFTQSSYDASVSFNFNSEIDMGLSYKNQSYESVGFIQLDQMLTLGIQYALANSENLGIIAGLDIRGNTNTIEGQQAFIGAGYSKELGGSLAEISLIFKPETYTIGGGSKASNYQRESIALNAIMEKVIGNYTWIASVDYIQDKSYKDAFASKTTEGITLTRLDDRLNFFVRYEHSAQSNIEELTLLFGITLKTQ